MAYYIIEKRKTSAGEVRYRCSVTEKTDGIVIYRERKTFAKQTLAKSWGIARVADIEVHGLPGKQPQIPEKTFGELMDLYTDSPHIKYSQSKADVLKLIRRCDIASLPLSELQQNSFVKHCQVRAAMGAGPSTIRMDISFIGSVLEAAKPMFNIDVDMNIFRNCQYYLLKVGMIASGGKRSRRATRHEVEQLVAALKARESSAYSKAPFSEIFIFSILSCMRIGEVTKIRWADINVEQKAVMVRDRKDPYKKAGNHMMVALLGDAWTLVQKQPRTDDRIFPFRAKSITDVYRQERNKLGIEDLRYHDLRREGISRLFEAGFSIEEVAQVSGHRSLKTLWQVYTELFPKSLHKRLADIEAGKNKEEWNDETPSRKNQRFK